MQKQKSLLPERGGILIECSRIEGGVLNKYICMYSSYHAYAEGSDVAEVREVVSV